jgi:hypothetical protein
MSICRTLFSAIGLALTLSVVGQSEFKKLGYINSVQLSQLDANYLVLQKGHNENGFRTFMAGIVVADGHLPNAGDVGLVKDLSGNTLRFTTLISVLNFMAFNGWEFLNKGEGYIFGEQDDYLFRKK